MASASTAAHPGVSAPRSAPRARSAKRRKAARPQPPRIPADFFDPKAYTLLIEVFSARAARWKADTLPPLYFYGRESEPHWDESGPAALLWHDAAHRGQARPLRMPVDGPGARAAPADAGLDARAQTSEGHTLEAWQAALAGVLWRIGQVLPRVRAPQRRGASAGDGTPDDEYPLG